MALPRIRRKTVAAVSLLALWLAGSIAASAAAAAVVESSAGDDDDNDESSPQFHNSNVDDGSAPIVALPTLAQHARRRQLLQATSRNERFPNRTERVKLYMSNWYVPPCPSTNQDKSENHPWMGFARYEYIEEKNHHKQDDAGLLHWSERRPQRTVQITEASNVQIQTKSTTHNTTSSAPPKTFIMESFVLPDKTFVLHRHTLLECAAHVNRMDAIVNSTTPNDEKEWTDKQKKAKRDYFKYRSNMRMYCKDVAHSVLPAMDHVEWEQHEKGDSYQFINQSISVADLSKSTRQRRSRQLQRRRLRLLQHSSSMSSRQLSLSSALQESSPLLQETQESQSSLQSLSPPILLQFGDLAHSHVYRYIRLPHFKKFRLAASRDEIERQTRDKCQPPNQVRRPLNYPEYESGKEDAFALSKLVLQPIVWKLATHRHYGLLDQVAQYDVEWDDKKSMAVFRGQLTGSLGGGYDKHVEPLENCVNLPRCRLVYNHANSTLVDAKLTSTRKRLPNVLNGVNLTTPSQPVTALLHYKAIVMLEGNDVASGLKWALLSNSVVLMPIPQHTSWCMEELLEPWVHYIPLVDDASDVESKMQWIVHHDDEAREMAHISTQWMLDLVYHADARLDDVWIQEDMVRRYQAHFAPVRTTAAV